MPRYEDGYLWTVRNERREPKDPGNPFAGEPFLLISSQLAKQRDQRQQLLDAGRWDLVVVDEAHHARRSGLEQGLGQPNRLLELLREISSRTRGDVATERNADAASPTGALGLARTLGAGWSVGC